MLINSCIMSGSEPKMVGPGVIGWPDMLVYGSTASGISTDAKYINKEKEKSNRINMQCRHGSKHGLDGKCSMEDIFPSII